MLLSLFYLWFQGADVLCNVHGSSTEPLFYFFSILFDFINFEMYSFNSWLNKLFVIFKF